MKTHWNDPKHGAPIGVRTRIEATLADRRQRPSHGERLADAMAIAFSAGFDFPEPELAVLDEFESLPASSLAVFERDHGTEVEQQRRARDIWNRYREWAKGPPAHELAQQAQANREAADRAAAVERRALELLADQERARLDASHRKAVQAAQKELEQ